MGADEWPLSLTAPVSLPSQSLITFVNKHLNKLNLEVTELETQVSIVLGFVFSASSPIPRGAQRRPAPSCWPDKESALQSEQRGPAALAFSRALCHNFLWLLEPSPTDQAA